MNHIPLEQLEQRIQHTLQGPELTPERVIRACDVLAQKLTESEFLPVLLATGMPEHQARRELSEARLMLSRGYLERRMAYELGEWPMCFTPYGSERPVRQV